MTTSALAIAEPPWEMATPATAQTITTAILAVALELLAIDVLIRIGTGQRPTPSSEWQSQPLEAAKGVAP
jgi:hypothetical protein